MNVKKSSSFEIIKIMLVLMTAFISFNCGDEKKTEINSKDSILQTSRGNHNVVKELTTALAKSTAEKLLQKRNGKLIEWRGLVRISEYEFKGIANAQVPFLNSFNNTFQTVPGDGVFIFMKDENDEWILARAEFEPIVKGFPLSPWDEYVLEKIAKE